MKLLLQPDDGISPLLEAINQARAQVEIAIFRCDRFELEEALANAVKRGVFVHALIASMNHGGERKLRKLETRLLASGVTVARTSDDLARYHGKFMIIDRRELHLYAFNFTHLDIDHSRSFGLITSNSRLVQEAVDLFEADVKRQPYSAKLETFVVSPVNARKELTGLVESARKELLIYDPEISDALMIRLLKEKGDDGVDVKILGRFRTRSEVVKQHRLPHLRLHARCIIRDGHEAFLGSQSLREVELAARREVGLIFRDPAIVGRLMKTFREDWDLAESFRETGIREPAPAEVSVT
ncbi:MAG TPA: phospholipase D-like domain-containing protein [Bryobacteraceae bacterium]|nr:phospholipase D-like domain-containing protein [Bryobacteraceae bacterium]